MPLINPPSIPATESQPGTTGAPTPRTLWSFQPVDTAKGPFQWLIGGASFSSVWDTVMYLGYNCANGGGRALAAEPSFRWVLEQDYSPSGTFRVIENYHEVMLPQVSGTGTTVSGSASVTAVTGTFAVGMSISGTGIPASTIVLAVGAGTLTLSANATASNSGVALTGDFQKRPFFMQINRATGAFLDFEFRHDGITYADWDDNTAIATMGRKGTGMSFLGHAQQASNTALAMTALNSQQCAFSMTDKYGTFQITSYGNSQWSVQSASGSVPLKFSGKQSGFNFTPDGHAVVQVQPLNAGWAGLTVLQLADPTQHDSLFAVQTSGGTNLSRFDRNGYFMTRKVSAPADAALATSEMAIWFDDTSGAAKLMVKAKDSGGTVRTASVALA